jgi:hypothetical protein
MLLLHYDVHALQAGREEVSKSTKYDLRGTI